MLALFQNDGLVGIPWICTSAHKAYLLYRYKAKWEPLIKEVGSEHALIPGTNAVHLGHFVMFVHCSYSDNHALCRANHVCNIQHVRPCSVIPPLRCVFYRIDMLMTHLSSNTANTIARSENLIYVTRMHQSSIESRQGAREKQAHTAGKYGHASLIKTPLFYKCSSTSCKAP